MWVRWGQPKKGKELGRFMECEKGERERQREKVTGGGVVWVSGSSIVVVTRRYGGSIQRLFNINMYV